ncbi:coil containing protein [Vibrio phage 1.082.O._10N.261.49.E4]|nr:coil containing protein [Vibrio phage 1.082.O._10N.261.49.E4]
MRDTVDQFKTRYNAKVIAEVKLMDIEKELHYLKGIAAEYAQQRAHMEYLKEFRKSKKAMLINEAAQSGLKTAQERESYAYSHEEYLCLLDGLKVATEEAERLRIMIKTCEMQIDAKKTREMRDMAEMRLR